MAKKPQSPTPAAESGEKSRRRRFDSAFKQEAVHLAKRIGIRQAAADLGVGESNLRNWTQAVATQGAQAFTPAAQRTDVDAELRRLREQVRVLTMERDILKKAAAYFAKESE
jgi:transposase